MKALCLPWTLTADFLKLVRTECYNILISWPSIKAVLYFSSFGLNSLSEIVCSMFLKTQIPE